MQTRIDQKYSEIQGFNKNEELMKLQPEEEQKLSSLMEDINVNLDILAD